MYPLLEGLLGARGRSANLALETTREEVRRVYEQTQYQVSDQESVLLHSRPLAEILTWTKTHLDAYLATAEVILEQNVDPG